VTESVRPVKTHLVCGFLGAGKTTFILEQLKRSGANVAVLVNEFGKLGIDGELVRSRGGIDVVELPGGCICCSQKEGLAAGIRAIAENIRPELLLIEPSGIAEASEVLKVLTQVAQAGVIRLGAVITVVDAETFMGFSEPEAFGPFFLDQLANADIVVINKTDLVGEDELAAIDQRIGQISTGALVLKTEYCRVDEALPVERVKDEIVSHLNALPFDCISLLPPPDVPVEYMMEFFTQVTDGAFGRILRTKGFLSIKEQGCFIVQGTGRRITMEHTKCAVDPRLTLIGFDLDEARITGFFAAEG